MEVAAETTPGDRSEPSPDPFSARETLEAGGRRYVNHRMEAVRDDLERTPFTVKVLLENVLRNVRPRAS